MTEAPPVLARALADVSSQMRAAVSDLCKMPCYHFLLSLPASTQPAVLQHHLEEIEQQLLRIEELARQLINP